MTASGDLAVTNPKPMDGQAAFFDGKIQVEAMLAKSDAIWKSAAGGDPTRSRGGAGGFTAGMGGGGRRGGGRGMGGEGGGGRREGTGVDERPTGAAGEGARGPAVRASDAPPVQLRLRLTNHGDASVDIDVLDFNSDLGNFAVQPTKITLSAGQTVEADPMISRLGVPAIEEIPITVRLRVGGKGGKTETQIVKLRPRADEPPNEKQP